MSEWIRKSPLASAGAIGVALILLSLITGFSQIKTEGLAWQEAHYGPYLDAVVSGEASAPSQYRVLTNYAVVAAWRFAETLGIPRPMGSTFVALRLLLNLALFALAFCFYRALKIPSYTIVIGLSALAWAMTQSNYGSLLALDAYTDILFYLLAALALVYRRPAWLVPIAVLAALNRETGFLIPIMALVASLAAFDGNHSHRDLRRNGVLALGLFVAIQLALWLSFGIRTWELHDSGATPGLSMLMHNLGNDAAWGHMAGTLGIVPLLALVSYRFWHPVLRPLCWTVVPIWVVGHLFTAPLEVSRVLLLPLVLLFIPGMLCGLAHSRNDVDSSAAAMVAS